MNVLKKVVTATNLQGTNDYCWQPQNKVAAARYMKKIREKIIQAEKKTANLNLDVGVGLTRFQHACVYELAELIDNNAMIRMCLTKMIDQVPSYYKATHDAHGFYLTSINEMLVMIDIILGTTPEYDDTDLVGFPINNILNWTMAMPAGGEAFRHPEMNAMLKKILNTWTDFLNSRESLKIFYTSDHIPEGLTANNSWCCSSAIDKLDMGQYLTDAQLAAYKKGYTDPDFPYQSWNDFFTRKFKDETQRPIAAQGIVSGCDSKVYNIQTDVKLQDWFWVKAQPYSLLDMLANDDLDVANPNHCDNNQHSCNFVQPFIGGTVYQAFLSATKYHRWHSPVTGKIKRAYIKDGTYYSAAFSEGMDAASPDLSQGYIAHTATRALLFIEADDPRIGLMCMMTIGMAEVSSNVINQRILDDIDKQGYATIQRGDELGYFQYGGSTHCLVFRPDVIKQFNVGIGDTVKMGESIATYAQS